MDIVLYCLAAAVIGFLLAWIIRKPAPTNTQGLETERQYLLAEKERLANELGEHKKALSALQLEKSQLAEAINTAHQQTQQTDKQNASLNSEIKYANLEIASLKEQLSTQKQQLDDIGKRFSTEFQNLAQNILDEKTKSFNELQEKSLTSLLQPLKDNINTFKSEFETKYTRESEERISLREQIKHMMELNQTLSAEAHNLTSALKGQAKQQGNWGEMILESILEFAGLQKGLHYFPQERTATEEGRALQPDVIVRYPDGRAIVIDSKVSLLHYEQYCSAADKPAQQTALQLLLQSFTRHIDSLSSKQYPEATGALDFVMMFVPVEGAYITVLQANPTFCQYAYNKRILLISPANLIAAMKLVHDLWKKDGISRNAQDIAERAVKIYEKLAYFIEDFEKVGSQLDKAAATFQEARKKLHTGKGNVISQALKMKGKLQHNKPARELPQGLVEEAEAGEDEV